MATLSSPCNRERFIFQILIKKSNSIKAKVPANRDLSAQISLNASSKVMTDTKISALFLSCIYLLSPPYREHNERTRKYYLYFKTGKSKYAKERWLALGYTNQRLNPK